MGRIHLLQVQYGDAFIIECSRGEKKGDRGAGSVSRGSGDRYTNLAQESASWRIKRRYSHYIMNKLGRFNVYRFNLITYLQYMLSVLLTKEKFAKIRTITAGIYNKKIKKQ